jgi:hypothetical protein
MEARPVTVDIENEAVIYGAATESKKGEPKVETMNHASHWLGGLYDHNYGLCLNTNYINDLKSDYLVKKKTIKVNKTGDYENIFYEYKLSNTYNGEQAINYFDNQRRKNEGNLEEGQFITRNVDIQDTALIVFDNLVVEEAQENSTLDCKLDSPL